MIRALSCLAIAASFSWPAAALWWRFYELPTYRARERIIPALDDMTALAVVGIVIALALFFAWPYLAKRFPWDMSDADDI